MEVSTTSNPAEVEEDAPGGAEIDTPPIPIAPGSELVTEGESFIELDENGVPLGRWEWDPDEEAWVFEEYSIPLALSMTELPKTGSDGAPGMMLLGAAMAGAGVLLWLGSSYKASRMR